MSLATSLNLLRLFDGGNIEKNSIQEMFCKEDLEIIDNMYNDKNIEDILDKDSGKYIITLTEKGNFILFIEDNRNDIYKFGSLLNDIGIDSSYLYQYLEKNYLTNYAGLFNINSYEAYLQEVKNSNNEKTRQLLISNRNIG